MLSLNSLMCVCEGVHMCVGVQYILFYVINFWGAINAHCFVFNYNMFNFTCYIKD